MAHLTILVVEDNDDLRGVTVAALQRAGHRVLGVESAEAVDDVLGKWGPDVLVLDLNLPGEDGISLASRIRAANPHIGIVMVTARHQSREVVEGYGSGADIYLTKPTTFDELHAALQALGRRVRARAPAPPSLGPHGGLVLRQATRRVQGLVAQVDLSAIECQLLAALAQAHDGYLESWQLVELTGKALDETSKSTLEVQIARLRKKLDQAGVAGPAIKAVRGAGYQLCVAVEVH